MEKYCNSCGMPISGQDGRDFRGSFCNYCSDENGNVYPRELVQKGIADWLKQMTPDNISTDFMKRAEYYLKAMPAWAEK
jgi:hypothetical protein